MKDVKQMDKNKRTIQGVNFDKIDEYINIKKIRKKYKSDKRFCWFTALKYHSLGIIVFLLFIIGIVLVMIEYHPTSLAEGYWMSLMILGFVGFMGFIVIGRFIEAVKNYQSELYAFTFNWYFYEHYNFKYCLSDSNISTGTFFIKRGVEYEWHTEPSYDLCYRNDKYKCNEQIKVIVDDTVKTPRFDILEMTLYIPKGYKMPTGEDVIYVNIDNVKEKKINR